MRATKNSTPWRIPHAIEPNSHSPRNRRGADDQQERGHDGQGQDGERHADDDAQLPARDRQLGPEQADVRVGQLLATVPQAPDGVEDTRLLRPLTALAR